MVWTNYRKLGQLTIIEEEKEPEKNILFALQRRSFGEFVLSTGLILGAEIVAAVSNTIIMQWQSVHSSSPSIQREKATRPIDDTVPSDARPSTKNQSQV